MNQASAIALIVVLTLFFMPMQWQAALGGGLLAVALARELGDGVGRWRHRQGALRRSKALDWTVIDSSLKEPRAKRDCERPETLGVCTGRECLVYDLCNYNIKRVGL